VTSKSRYFSSRSAKEQFTFTQEYAACCFVGSQSKLLPDLNQYYLIWRNINLFMHSLMSKFSTWTLLNKNNQFHNCFKSVFPAKKHLSTDFPVRFSCTLASLYLSKCFLRWSACFAQASLSYKMRLGKHHHLKTLHTAVFYLYINRLSNVVYISRNSSHRT